MKTTTHLMAQPVLVASRFNRQRCAWCGELVVDEDLTLMASTDPDFSGSEWPPNRLLRVTAGNPTVFTVMPDAGGYMPRDSCMARFLDALEESE